jgi:hypothetical protein
MLIEYMFSSTRAGEAFTFQAYQKADGIFGIVRDYLSKQLSDAQDDAGELRLVLIALVKSYGVKAQRSLKELTAETGLDVARCDVLLERLIDRRLVRHISGQYEVSHDFLAKIIMEKLVDSEEREFKRFRELLSSRAAAFVNTTNRLTVEEVLFLYKRRQRIAHNSAEAILIIDTWIKDDVPGLFWIKEFDKNLVERHLATYESANLEREQRFKIVILKYLFALPINNDDCLAMLKIYRGAQQAADILIALGDHVPTSVALLGLRKRQSAIKSACGEILRRRLENQNGKLSIEYMLHKRIPILAYSSS